MVFEPRVDRVSRSGVTLNLKASSEENGGLSYYFLVVVPVYNATKRPQDFKESDVCITPFLVILYGQTLMTLIAWVP